METNCMQTLNINGSKNPWAGMTGSWEEEEANKFIPDETINNQEFEFYSHLDIYKIDNYNLLGKHKEKNKVMIEKKYFSELHKVDATGLNRDRADIVGVVYINRIKKTSLRNIVLFLLEAQIINTYIHMEANLCLVKEDDAGDEVYSAYFTGEHIYYTNKKNIEPLKFVVNINKKTGKIVVQ